MPNGEQEQDLEGEASGGDSGEWHSDGEEDEESDDSSDEEEVESPPRRERRSKLDQERPSAREKAIAQTGQSSKRPRTSSPPQLKKCQSISKLQSRSLGRRCRRLRLTSPSLLCECLPLYSLDAPCCLFFLDLTRRTLELAALLLPGPQLTQMRMR